MASTVRFSTACRTVATSIVKRVRKSDVPTETVVGTRMR